VDAALETLARADGVTGELTLRRRVAADPRVDPVYELIVDGVFLMDTAETSTERLLADAVLDRLAVPRRILVGGLGLGVTLAALLTDVRVDRVDVVEIEPLLVRWLRAGLVPPVDAVLADPRVHVTVADISDVLRDVVINTYDGVLLDVDNGPDFLVRAANAAVYRNASMRDVARALVPGGVLAVWSAAPSSDLATTVADEVGPCEEVVRTVERDGRPMTYHIYLARRRA
jgi:spermidine synthase